MFGAYALELIATGRLGQMVAYSGGQIGAVPLAEAVGRLKTVDLGGSMTQTARALGISVGDKRIAFPRRRSRHQRQQLRPDFGSQNAIAGGIEVDAVGVEFGIRHAIGSAKGGTEIAEGQPGHVV